MILNFTFHRWFHTSWELTSPRKTSTKWSSSSSKQVKSIFSSLTESGSTLRHLWLTRTINYRLNEYSTLSRSWKLSSSLKLRRNCTLLTPIHYSNLFRRPIFRLYLMRNACKLASRKMRRRPRSDVIRPTIYWVCSWIREHQIINVAKQKNSRRVSLVTATTVTIIGMKPNSDCLETLVWTTSAETRNKANRRHCKTSSWWALRISCKHSISSFHHTKNRWTIYRFKWAIMRRVSRRHRAITRNCSITSKGLSCRRPIWFRT